MNLSDLLAYEYAIVYQWNARRFMSWYNDCLKKVQSPSFSPARIITLLLKITEYKIPAMEVRIPIFSG